MTLFFILPTGLLQPILKSEVASCFSRNLKSPPKKFETTNSGLNFRIGWWDHVDKIKASKSVKKSL